MYRALTGITASEVFLTIGGSIMFAELVGYALHRLLHSERFPALSRGHMIHHFHLYGPHQAMRAPAYKNATQGRMALGNVGMEWLLPSAGVVAACWVLFWSFGVPWPYATLALATMLAWSVFMFSYLHDRMHLEHFWMERIPLLKTWFVGARRLHDIHHHSLNDDGQMNRNFGIGFFFFDRVFRTMSKRHCPLNWYGYRRAAQRYRIAIENDEEFAHFPSAYRV